MLALFARKLRTAGLRLKRWLWPPVDVYATHVPTLIGLPRIRSVRRIVEFGCGPFSTLTFLDRKAYPELAELVSYETDPAWLKKLLLMSKGDPRLDLKLVPDPMADTVARIDLEPFDIVFVDDSVSIQGRAATISAVLNRPFSHPWVVLHDMENPAYRAVIPDLVDALRFETYTPHTWIVWSKGAPVPAGRLANLSNVIGRNASGHRPDERSFWINAVSSID